MRHPLMLAAHTHDQKHGGIRNWRYFFQGESSKPILTQEVSMNYFTRFTLRGAKISTLCLSALLVTAALHFNTNEVHAQGRCEDPSEDPNLDTDQDGEADCEDGCPQDGAKSEPGQCGCGVSDADSDGDFTANCADQCPTDRLQVSTGACGCGFVQRTDVDDNGELYGCGDVSDYYIPFNYVTVRVNRNRSATLTVRPWSAPADFVYRVDKQQQTPRGFRWRTIKPVATISGLSPTNNTATISGLPKSTNIRVVGQYVQGAAKSETKTIVFRTK
jgi:hypothetical protein